MEKNELLKNIKNYFANTSIEHLQKVYDELKEYNQYGPTVEEYVDGCTRSKDKSCDDDTGIWKSSSQDIPMFHLA